MAGLTLEQATRRFAPDRAAVDRVDLKVEDGEFLAVLGPSGCGKTTLLRLVAGFEKLDGGTIRLGEALVAGPTLHLPPEERRVGVVFQSYALWPHMSVARNVGYALEVRGLRGDDYKRRVAAAMKTVGLAEFAERRPASLSGGQRQRVALARCLAMEPRLVLLDEPLANLDVHLRHAMQDEFADFHRTTGATMLYVTHDQAEALALADRVAVMDGGKLVQLADPRTLYREPATAMVASFIGKGAVVPAAVVEPRADGHALVEVLGARASLRAPASATPGPARVLLRPEDLALSTGEGIAATVKRTIYQGAQNAIELAPTAAAGEMLLWFAPPMASPKQGETVRLQVTDGWVIPA
ncbi:MAG: ABC transporter ATP-binding protein [Alphaproteobacteria bacterium]|nr:ABC transporter ATP-binding protein [Alphaproteobacteria bacterium]